MTQKVQKKLKDITGDTPVRLSLRIVEKVKRSKKKTGVPVKTFFEKAAQEKLARDSGEGLGALVD